MKKVLKRRKREHKTDYGKRFKLLKSGAPRLVFRRTNKYVIAQYVTSYEAQDKVLWEIDSRKLLSYGWPKSAKGSLKSISASYLVGYFVSKKIAKEKLEKPIVDFGMARVLHKTRVYGFIKGLIDGGLEISCKEEAFPNKEKLEGNELKNKIPFEEIKGKING